MKRTDAIEKPNPTQAWADYEAAAAAYDELNEKRYEAFRASKPPTAEQKQYWARCRRRLVHGSANEAADRRGLQQEREFVLARYGGRELERQVEAALRAMHKAHAIREWADGGPEPTPCRCPVCKG